jgi:YidC/Oxa1 family membrane protein insertase
MTGITDADLVGAPHFEDLAEEILGKFENAIFVAHNSQFDYGFLKEEFRRLGYGFVVPQLCTVRLSRALYKEHKVNPLGSCLPLLIQLPILIALYQVFNTALNGNLNGLYHIVSNPGSINPYFLGFINLAKPNVALAVLAGVLQYWQSRLMQSQNKVKPTDATAKAIQWQTTYFLPLFSVFIAWSLPSGLPLYWVVTTLFAVAQQYYIMRQPDTHQGLEVKQ